MLRSTQLRVCKAELPIVEVILKHPSLASATKYLGVRTIHILTSYVDVSYV